MACELFIPKRFHKESLALIEKANLILGEYETQGLVLTLRQLYYQFVARGFIANSQTDYKRLGGIISDARLAGMVDWNMMEDRTRHLRGVTTWSDPATIVNSCAYQYKEDLWEGQSYRPEVWIEKDALIGVIERACSELRTDYFACRGYTSQSAQYEAGKRFQRYLDNGQTPVVFHFGDHDPSGIDMTRDNGERIGMFSRYGVQVRRLALTYAQVQQYNPPPNPTKETDSRAGGYIAEYGTESWELDALEPTAIDALIRENIDTLINKRKWREAVKKEKINRDLLQRVSDGWNDVQKFVTP